MNSEIRQFTYSLIFSLILIFSMNIQAFAAFVDYDQKMEVKNKTSNTEEDSSNFSSSNTAEENETKNSNSFETLEKLNPLYTYCLNVPYTNKHQLEFNFFHIDLYSILKSSLNTPPPELV